MDKVKGILGIPEDGEDIDEDYENEDASLNGETEEDGEDKGDFAKTSIFGKSSSSDQIKQNRFRASRLCRSAAIITK